MLSLSSLLLAVGSSVVASSGVGEGIRIIGGEGLNSKLLVKSRLKIDAVVFSLSELRLDRWSRSNGGIVDVELSIISG